MQRFVFGLLALTGFVFWWIIGFPFANHNESYVWVALLDHVGFADVLRERLFMVANYRPLGQAVAWLGYHLSGGKIWPVEVFNAAVMLVAWGVLFGAIKEKKVVSLVAFAVGGALFSGYIYLFHLHGVFYSPLFLFMALLFVLYRPPLTTSRIVTAAMVAYLVAFFHPYSLLLYLAASFGLALETWKSVTVRQKMFLALSALLALVLIKLLVFVSSAAVLTSPADIPRSLITSYRSVEVNRIVTVVIYLLCLATWWSVTRSSRMALAGALLLTVISAVIVIAQLPLLPLWIALCLIKLVSLRRWWLTFIILATAAIPGSSPSGSPTYTIFVVMLCAGATAYGWTAGEDQLRVLRPEFVAGICGVLLLVALTVRLGVHVPVVTSIATPIMAEREKTEQMEAVLRWMLTSEYRDRVLVMKENAGSPSETSNFVDRVHRPPASQEDANGYLDFHRPRPRGDAVGHLVLSFGDDPFPGTIVFSVEGAFAGKACVFLPEQ